MRGCAVIVTALTNEAPYLLEWFAHYKALGFDGAVIFTSHCEDGTDKMVARLAGMGLALHVPLDLKTGRDPLRFGLRDLPERLLEIGARWAMVVDVDEYLAIRTDAGDLDSLVRAAGPADAISISRKPFGSSGTHGLPDGAIREIYCRTIAEDHRGPMITRGIKTLFRPEKVARVAPHRPYFPDVGAITWVDAGGQAMPEDYFEGQWAVCKGFSHRFARLHYYAVPSPEAFILRRGVPKKENQRKALIGDWRKLDADDETDAAMAGPVSRSAALLDELRADPVLAARERTGRDWHAAQIKALLQDEKLAALCAEMAGAGKPAPSKPKPKPKPKQTKPPEPRRTAPRGGQGAYTPPPVRPVRFDVTPAANGKTRAMLHGGFHKTATTHLQRLLEDNAPWLGGQSVYVVPHQKLRKHITFPAQLDAYRALKIHRKTRFSEAELDGFSQAFFAEPLARRPARMILSDENIPGLPAHCVTTGKLYCYRQEFLRRFARRLPLPVSEVFLAVRGYTDFFASSYVEYLRAATTTTTGRMVTPEEMRHHVLARLPEWHSVLRDFAAAFPEARIHVWRFEDFRPLEPRILQSMCGDAVDVGKLKEAQARRARPTASARAVEELVLISEEEGAATMAGRLQDVQARFPPAPENGRFDPWTATERAHLDRLYARDWDAIRADSRLTVLEP